MKTCPHCRKTFPTVSTERNPVEPADGDVTLCTRCGQFGIFDGAGVRLPTAEEAIKMKAHPGLNALLDRWRRLHQ